MSTNMHFPLTNMHIIQKNSAFLRCFIHHYSFLSFHFSVFIKTFVMIYSSSRMSLIASLIFFSSVFAIHRELIHTNA